MNFGVFLSIFFPRRCVACDKNLEAGVRVVCSDCIGSVHIYQGFFCGLCGGKTPLAPSRAISENRCHPGSRFFIGGAAAYENKTVKGLVHALKFRGVEAAAPFLAVFLKEYIVRLAINLEGLIVIPIPLSRKRLHTRGFNQSELIAKKLAESLELTIETNYLFRTKHTKPQSETKSLAERKENIRGCFTAGENNRYQGCTAILIDDVTTSGSTFKEAARPLFAAGISRIYAFAVAMA